MRARERYLWLCVPHLLGLGEWKLFADPAERERALADITAGRLESWVGLATRPATLLVSTVAGVVGVVSVADAVLGSAVGASHKVGGGICVAVVALQILFWFVHRPACRGFLRLRLRELGVPICLVCGYDLGPVQRGVAGVVCPECGSVNGPAKPADVR